MRKDKIMMLNFLPDISEDDKRVLEAFADGGSGEYAVLKRVIQLHLDHFRDIRNVNPEKDNVGLQVCSHLRAYDMLEEIFAWIVPRNNSHEEKRSNSFR